MPTQPAPIASPTSPAPTSTAPIAPAPTAAVAATGTPTTAAAGAILFRDDFTDPKSGWDNVDDPKFSNSYANGKFRMLVKADDGLDFAQLLGKDFSEVSVEVDVVQTAGPDDGVVGLLCRGGKGGYAYLFVVSGKGQYGIFKQHGPGPSPNDTDALAYYVAQPSNIKPVKSSNHIRADCIGNTFALTVNDQKLAQIVDDDKNFKSGTVGIFVAPGDSNKGGEDALISNFVVRQGAPPVAALPAIPLLNFGEIVIQDPLSKAGIFAGQAGTDVSAFYANGGLRVSAKNKKVFITTAMQNLKDVSVELTAVKNAGPDDNSIGILCRYQDQDNYYSLVIAGDGFFGIAKQKAGTYKGLSTHVRLMSALKAGDKQANSLRADCVGNKFTLYANGQKLDEVQDDDFKTGDVGFIVQSGQDAVDVTFNNFIARTP